MTELERHLTETRSTGSDGFSLSFKDGLGVLTAGPMQIGDLVTVKRLELLMPDISFPFDLPKGVFGLRHRRHVLGHIEMTVYVDPLAQLIREHLSTHAFFRLWALSVEDEFIQVLMVDSSGKKEVPFSFRLCPSGGTAGLGLCVENIVAYGPLKGNLLGCAAGALEALSSVRPDGFELQLPGILREVLFHLLPPRAWRLPDESEVRLTALLLYPDRIDMAFSHPDLLPDAARLAINASKDAARLRVREEYRITESGDRLVTENQPEKARAIYTRLLDRDPGSPFAAARIGMLDVVDSDRRQTAFSALESVRQRYPERVDLIAPMVQGAALSQAQASEIQLLYKLTEIGTPLEQLGANTRLGELYLDTEPKKAIAALECALATRREDPRALATLIEAAAKLGDKARVERLVPRWIAAHPRGSARAKAHVAAGRVYLILADPKEAVHHFERAELHHPDSDAPLFGIAEASRQLGETDRAIQTLERLERILLGTGRRKEASDALAMLGEIWLEKGEIGLSIQRFSASLELHPDHPERRLRLALLLSQSARPAEAARELEQVFRSRSALSSAPWFGDAAVALAQIYFFELKDADAARHWARQAALLPTQCDAARELIRRALLQDDRPLEEMISELSPQQIRRLADDFLLIDETERALESLERGMSQFPEHVDLADRLIEESRLAGDKRRLKKALSERIDSVASVERRAEMAEELGQLELKDFDNPASAICCFRDALEIRETDAAKQGLDIAFGKLTEQANALLEQGDFEAADTLFEALQTDIDDADPKMVRLMEAEKAFTAGAFQEAYDIALSLKKTRREIRKRAAVVTAMVERERGRKREAVQILEETASALAAADATALYLLAIDISPRDIASRQQVLTTLKLNRDEALPQKKLDQAIVKLLAMTGDKLALAEHLITRRDQAEDPERLRRAARLFSEVGKSSRAVDALERLYRETGAIEDLFLLVDALKDSERFDLLIGILEERRDTDPRVEQLLKQELASYSSLLQRQSERVEELERLQHIALSSGAPGTPPNERELLGKGGLLDDDNERDLQARLSAAFDLARKKNET